MKKMFNYLTMIIFVITLLVILPNNVYAQTEVAKIGNNTYDSLYDAVIAAKDEDIVELLKDTTETKVISIDKKITINGNNHKISSNSLQGTNAAFLINTDKEIVINKINIETNTRGIAINNSNHNITLKNSTLSVGERGITVNTDNNDHSILNIENSIIQKNGIDNYNEEVKNDASRGISLWEYKNSTITLKNTTVEGFAYVINVTAPSTYDSSNTKIVLDNCILKGRSGINYSNTTGLEMEIKNSEILGINNQSGKSERFGNIVIYDASNITLNMENTKLTNYQNEVGQNNPNALQYMFDIRSSGNNITIKGDSSFIDTTNKLNSVFWLSNLPNNIEITGGKYSYDVSDFISDKYQMKLENGYYIVSKIEPQIEVTELDLNKDITEISIGSTDVSSIKKVLVSTLYTTEEIDIEDKNVKIKIDINDIKGTESLTNNMKKVLTGNKKDAKFVKYFDISLNVINVDTNSVIGTLTELNDTISFSILLPSEFQKVEKGYQRKYYIIREHNNEYEIMNTKQDGMKLTFETDKFSSYALVYIDEPVVQNPNTYDGIIRYIIVGSISLFSFMMVYIKRKKILH